MLVVMDQTCALFPTWKQVYPCPGFCSEAAGSEQGLAVCWLTHMLSAQLLSRVRLCDPRDCSPPGSSVHGILQGRVLEWVTISSCRGSSRPGLEPGSPVLQADSLLLSHHGSPCCTCASRELWTGWQEAVPSAMGSLVVNVPATAASD